MEKSKNILLCGWYGSLNIGDDAILEGIIHGFKTYIPEVQLTVLSNRPNETKEKYNVESIYLWKRFKGFCAFLKTLVRCDLFIVGGGSLIQDVSSLANIVHWLIKILLAKILGKKTILMAIGADYFRYPVSRLLAKVLLNRVKFISTRDAVTRDIFISIGICRPPIYPLSDPASLVKPAASLEVPEIFKKEGINFIDKIPIAVNVRQLYRQRKFFDMDQRKWEPHGKLLYEKLVSNIADLIVALQTEFKSRMIFMPFQVSESDNDNIAIKDIIAKISDKKNLYTLKGSYSPSQLMSILGAMKLVISMRLHPLILAAGMGVPVFGLSYSPKTEGFLKQLDMEEFAIPVNNLHIEDALVKIKKILTSRGSVIKVINQNMEKVRRQAQQNFDLIKKEL